VVPEVAVYNTSGNKTFTDSSGSYHINVSEHDTLRFFYNGKFSYPFPVSQMADHSAFDISLKVRVTQKYKLLKGVTVYTNSYKFDSLENRETYSKIFGNSNPTLRSQYEDGGPAGLDINELIGIFQFRKNKRQLAFQKRLIDEEEERYIDYRFSSNTISRITGLKSPYLEEYKKLYRPSYFFTSNSSITQFYEYILSTSYTFKKDMGIE
jgi:hypothetical protein